jgi:hypothetical protein
LAIREINKNHNHDLKNIFKGAATRAAATAGPFQEFYEARIAGSMKPAMARLTLAQDRGHHFVGLEERWVLVPKSGLMDSSNFESKAIELRTILGHATSLQRSFW